jgi:HEAT repeat protein
MDVEAKIKQLEDLGSSYLFIVEMQRISRDAAAGNGEALAVLEAMLDRCAPGDWKTRNSWCSAAVHALANTGTRRALAALIRHIQTLTPGVAFGPVELIASLLPVFEEEALEPAFEMAASENPPVRAIGTQVLCNFFLEGNLPQSAINRLEDLLRDFRKDNYLTQHVADLVRFKLARNARGEDGEDIEEMFADFLVESTGG